MDWVNTHGAKLLLLLACIIITHQAESCSPSETVLYIKLLSWPGDESRYRTLSVQITEKEEFNTEWRIGSNPFSHRDSFSGSRDGVLDALASTAFCIPARPLCLHISMNLVTRMPSYVYSEKMWLVSNLPGASQVVITYDDKPAADVMVEEAPHGEGSAAARVQFSSQIGKCDHCNLADEYFLEVKGTTSDNVGSAIFDWQVIDEDSGNIEVACSGEVGSPDAASRCHWKEESRMYENKICVSRHDSHRLVAGASYFDIGGPFLDYLRVKADGRLIMDTTEPIASSMEERTTEPTVTEPSVSSYISVPFKPDKVQDCSGHQLELFFSRGEVDDGRPYLPLVWTLSNYDGAYGGIAHGELRSGDRSLQYYKACLPETFECGVFEVSISTREGSESDGYHEVGSYQLSINSVVFGEGRYEMREGFDSDEDSISFREYFGQCTSGHICALEESLLHIDMQRYQTPLSPTRAPWALYDFSNPTQSNDYMKLAQSNPLLLPHEQHVFFLCVNNSYTTIEDTSRCVALGVSPETLYGGDLDAYYVSIDGNDVSNRRLVCSERVYCPQKWMELTPIGGNCDVGKIDQKSGKEKKGNSVLAIALSVALLLVAFIGVGCYCSIRSSLNRDSDNTDTPATHSPGNMHTGALFDEPEAIPMKQKNHHWQSKPAPIDTDTEEVDGLPADCYGYA